MKKSTQRSWPGWIVKENGRWAVTKKCPGKKSSTKTFDSEKAALEWISTCPMRKRRK